jgi:hypothetical protein
MNLTAEQIQKFQALYAERYGSVLDADEAKEQGNLLIAFVKLRLEEFEHRKRNSC